MPEASEGLYFLDFWIVTFSNLIESKGSVEGETGYLSKKISRDLRSDGSKQEGEEMGL